MPDLTEMERQLEEAHKPCSQCPHKSYLPLTDHAIEAHLAGQKVIGLGVASAT